VPRRWRTSAVWAVVAIVAGLSLAVGSGAFSGGHAKAPSLYQRTMQVAGEYRCPVCAGESVATSDAAEAVEIRGLIQGWLAEGRSQAQIRSYLVDDYGPSILEKPPASGIGVLIWVLPVVFGVLCILGLVLVFAYWRRAGVVGADPYERRPRRLARSVRVATLAPATTGAAVTAVAPATTVAAATTADEGLVSSVGAAEHGDEQEAALKTPAHPLFQRISLVAGVGLIVAAGALFLVDRSSSQRVPGGTISGGVTGVDAELEQAAALASSNPTAALAVYDAVLSSDPNQPVALSGEGWIYAEAGFATKAEGLLQKAEKVDPTYPPPHLYRGLVLLEDERQPAAAIKELKWFLAHGPDPAMAKAAQTALAQAEAKL
jgi:cytochrome c-type biogenesis protein CcmH/NrfF